MNYQKPLHELQRINKKDFHFVDTVKFGVILSKKCILDNFKKNIKEKLYRVWP